MPYHWSAWWALMPFDTTKVIPAGWSARHAPVAAGGMNATVTIGARTGTTTSGDDTVSTWGDDYTGPARVQAVDSGTEGDVAAQNIAGRPYLVQIEYGAGTISEGGRVRVTAAPNDPMLVGQDLWIVDIQLGSERFTRDLICSDNQTDSPAAN